MIYIDHALVQRTLDPDSVLALIDELFVADARSETVNFPVVREATPFGGAIFGIRSGMWTARRLLGFKAGGYWPCNAMNSLSNHQSSICLIDPVTGRLDAVIADNHITSLRTAAACASSIQRLSRSDARILSIFGAGGQARTHIEAAIKVRKFDKVLICNRSEDQARSLAWACRASGIQAETSDAKITAEQADVIITLTASTAPLFEADWAKAGTHIAAMDADTLGKQELDLNLLRNAALFTDNLEQSSTIGEFQQRGTLEPVPLSKVSLIGTATKRPDCAITIYDGTGTALQDLVAAQYLLQIYCG